MIIQKKKKKDYEATSLFATVVLLSDGYLNYKHN